MTRKPHQQQLLDFYAVSERPTRPSPPGPMPAQNPQPPRGPADTQLEAHERMKPRAATVRARVLKFLVERGMTGATDQEVQQALGLSSQSEGPRRIELMRAGHVVDSGQRRRTRSGRAAIVWRTTYLAMRAADG